MKTIHAFGTSATAIVGAVCWPAVLVIVVLLVVSVAAFLRWYARLSPAQWRAFEGIVRAWRQR